MKKFAVKTAFLFAIGLFVFSLFTSVANAATIQVKPSSLGKWQQASSGSGTSTFVAGPSTPAIGSGSIRFQNGADGTAFTEIKNANNGPTQGDFYNTRLDQISNLSYSTYTSSWGSSNKPAILILEIDNSADAGSGSIDRLIFDARNNTNQAVPSLNQWQIWDAKNGSFESVFTAMGVTTIANYLTVFPNAVISPGGVRLGMGLSSNSSDVFDGNVDNFTFNANTYDFDPDGATNNYTQQFYSDNNFQNPAGTPTNGITNPMKFNWGMGSPAAGVPVDNFSAKWEGTFDFTAEKYRFVGTSDNIFKIYVDGELVVNRLSRGAGQGAKNMTAGVHTVKIEYIHGTGNSNIMTGIGKASECYDMNGDNKINSADQLALTQHFGFNGFSPWDLNNDDKITSGDQLLMAQDFGKTCPHN